MKYLTLIIISVCLTSCAGIQRTYSVGYDNDTEMFTVGVILTPIDKPIDPVK